MQVRPKLQDDYRHSFLRFYIATSPALMLYDALAVASPWVLWKKLHIHTLLQPDSATVTHPSHGTNFCAEPTRRLLGSLLWDQSGRVGSKWKMPKRKNPPKFPVQKPVNETTGSFFTFCLLFIYIVATFHSLCYRSLSISEQLFEWKWEDPGLCLPR